MQKLISLRLLPSEAASDALLRKAASQALGIPEASLTGFHLLKRSIDARGKQPWVNLTLQLFIDEPFVDRNPVKWQPKDIRHVPATVVIVGAGPAGLFAALKLIENNIRPVILERGKDVRARRRDLAL